MLPSTGRDEEAIIDHLAKLYEQPKANLWEDGKVYFLPEEHGIMLLSEAHFKNLRVYRANVWLLHWAPEKFPVLVWVVGRKGGLQLGVLAGPDEVASSFPSALKGLVFERQDARASLALLVGRMVDVFYSERSSGTLQVTPEGNCEWAEQVQTLKGAHRRVAASCFSENGVLETIILPRRG